MADEGRSPTAVPLRPRGRLLVRLTALVGVLMLLSRIMGFVRSAVMADLYGQGQKVNLFSAAYTVPDSVYMVLTGGTIASAFIPVLVRLRAEGREETLWEVASGALTWAGLVTIVLTVVGIATASLWVALLMPGLSPAGRQETAALMQVMLGTIFFNALCAVLFGIQSAHHRYLATGSGPVVYNLAIIAVGLLLNARMGIMAFAWGMLLGSAANFVISLSGLWHLRPRLRLGLFWGHPELGRVGRAMLPILVTTLLGQAALFATQSALGSYAQVGVINALVLASRLMLLPVGVGITMGITLLPALSGEALVGQERVQELLVKSLRAVFFLTFPASLGLFLVSRPVVEVLFAHGRFGEAAVVTTTTSLMAYSLGVSAYALLEIAQRGFYALGDTWRPALAATGGLLVSLGVGIPLLPLWGPVGLALAYVLGGFGNLILLLFWLQGRLGSWRQAGLWRDVWRTVLAALGMAVAVAATSQVLRGVRLPPFLELGILMAVGGGFYTLLALALRCPEVQVLRRRGQPV